MKNMRAVGSDGLTLVELMLAVALIALGSVLVIGAFPSIGGTIESSKDAARATYHATTVIEEIGTIPSTALESYVPPMVHDLGRNELVRVSVVSNTGDEIQLPTDFGTIAGGVPDPVEVRVRVQWTDDAGRPRTITLASKKSIS